MNRREFLQTASATAALHRTAFARNAAPAVKPLRLGVIGPGSRGQEDMRQFLRVPGVSISAVCDIYPPRFAQVNALVGHDVPHTSSPAALLERDDIDDSPPKTLDQEGSLETQGSPKMYADDLWLD